VKEARETKKLKFLIAGFGSIGRRHFRNLLALGERDIVFYRTHQGTLPPDELAGFVVETDLQKALSHWPDAVIVANPTSLHLDVAIPAAEAGCHLFMEKPISHTLARVGELREAVSHGSRQLFVGFQYRFHPGLQKVRDLVSSDKIGRPLSARAHWGEYLPGWHPWEDYRQGYSARSDLGGGVTLTLCHPLDYLRWIMGEVSELWAFTGHLGDLDLEVEDTAEIGLRFSNGALGSVHLDYNQQPPAHRLEIVGTQGTIRWNNTDGTVALYKAGEDSSTTAPPLWERIQTATNFDRNEMFQAEMAHFISIVNSEVPPLCTLEDGIRALELALAAHRSQSTKQVVRLQENVHV
jgi:predicted dehydrogenase